MSTRGVAAVKTEDGWEGVYNHSDSYPTYLGKKVWETIVKEYDDLEKFAEDLLSYTDWREYLNGGVCEYCGQKGVGQPHSISGGIFGFNSDVTDNDEEIEKKIEETGYPDPDAEHHGHTLDGDKTVEETHVTSERPNPLHIEWVYVIDTDNEIIKILTGKGYGKDGNVKQETKKLDNGYWDYGHCAYKHVKLAEIDLNGEEPYWQLIKDLDSCRIVTTDSDSPELLAKKLKEPSELCIVCDKPIEIPDEMDEHDLEYATFCHDVCFEEKLEDLNADKEEIMEG